MNVLIDTNVILDDLLNREPNKKTAREVSKLAVEGVIEGYITASCLTDIFYLVSKKLNNSIAKQIVKNLIVSFEIISVDANDCLNALNTHFDDFEDALVLICAEKAALDFIITNDKLFLHEKRLSVPTISPSDFILMHNK